MYLGLPQEHGTFGISDYKPEISKENKSYFKINAFTSSMTSNDIQAILEDIKLRHEYPAYGKRRPNLDLKNDIMGEFTFSQGKDEGGSYVSYYDKWDLDNPLEKIGVVGKPFEIYDRIYYDPHTFDVLTK